MTAGWLKELPLISRVYAGHKKVTASVPIGKFSDMVAVGDEVELREHDPTVRWKGDHRGMSVKARVVRIEAVLDVDLETLRVPVAEGQAELDVGGG